MGPDIYVVVTREEIQKNAGFPNKIAYLGCHFGGEGLLGLPDSLPEGSMLLIDDRAPPKEADIAPALKQLGPLLPKLSGIYLDFQNPATSPEAARALAENLSIPLGVPSRFSIPCKKVLPPRPLNILPDDYIPKGANTWLEAALTCWQVSVDRNGCRKKEIPRKPDFSGITYEKLYCAYRVVTEEERAVFTFQNTREDLHREISSLSGAERVLVLYQDFYTQES